MPRTSPLFSKILLIGLTFSSLNAAYIPVYSTTDNGGLSWTGNALGLNKALNQNEPGTVGSIGAFSSLSVPTAVGNFPNGTTLSWLQNGSAAILDLPEGSTVLHAELIWSGSYGFDPAVPLSLADTPITFTTPSVPSTIVAPNPATAQNRVNNSTRGFYVRSADVTSLVTVKGQYAVSGVPGTAIATENNNNCAGWTLAVAYRNAGCQTSHLSLFVACENAGDPPALVTGFRTPDNGAVTSRLFVSALEGDAQSTGDRVLVNTALPLNPLADRVSGTNNPLSNFFASQINTLLLLVPDLVSGKLIASGSSLLDTRGTFGLLNSLASGTSITSARQGYDITSVDLSSRIANSQQSLYIQGTSTGENYTINALGTSIQVQAPIILSSKSSNITVGNLNDIATFTMTFTNIGENPATNLIFKDNLPTALTFLPATFQINGIATPSNIVTGTPIGNLAVGGSVTVSFQAQINQVNPPLMENIATVDYEFMPLNGTPLSLTSKTNIASISAPNIPPPVVNPDTGTTDANTTLNGQSVLNNDVGTELSILSYQGISDGNATVNMQPDGTYIYAPQTGYSGNDHFTYTVKDALNQQATTDVFITVLPVAIGDTASVASNTTLIQSNSILNNDSGVGLSVLNANTISTGGGTVSVAPDGTYTYKSALNFSGFDSFEYTLIDGAGNTSRGTVTISVFFAAANDFGLTSANTPLDGSTTFTTIVGPGIFITSYQAVSNQGGTVVMNTANGLYTYTPPNGFSGADQFNYTVDSNGVITVYTVFITVIPVAVDNAYSTPINTFLNGTSVLLNDIGSGLIVAAFDPNSIRGGTISNFGNGTFGYTPPLNFSGFDSFTYLLADSGGYTATATVTINITPVSGADAATTYAGMTLVGPSVLLNDLGSALVIDSFSATSAEGGQVSMNTDGTYTYVPPAGFSGIDTFNYVARDGSGNLTGAVVTITVLPFAADDFGSTPQNTPFNGPSVYDNDIGSNLYLLGFQTPTSQGGTVVFNADGSYLYTPPLGFIGLDTFTYTIVDVALNTATATVFITVTAEDAPTDFLGRVKKCRFLNKTTYRLETTWEASSDAAIYRIYFNGVVVATIPATAAPLEYSFCLSSKKSADNYAITAVNAFNAESAPVPIRIVP